MSQGVPEWVCPRVHTESHRGGPVTPAFLTVDCGEAPCVCKGRLQDLEDLRRDLAQPITFNFSHQQSTLDSSGDTAWQELEAWLPIAFLDCCLFLPERTHTLCKIRETGVSEVRCG